MKNLIYKFFKTFGFRVITNDKDLKVRNQTNLLKQETEKLKFLLSDQINYSKQLFKTYQDSKSQICQDWFVLDHLDLKKDGFFVEIGAASGIDLSNTYLLEKKFNWTGILCEPSIFWQQSLKANRNCLIDSRCVYTSSGSEIDFLETSHPEYSTIDSFQNRDSHSDKRKVFNQYKVKTITLEDLLDFHNSPKVIDYLSVDTEGSEYDILKNFNFDKFQIRIITVENNNTENKALFDNLLLTNKYKKVMEEFSQFESWYINERDLVS